MRYRVRFWAEYQVETEDEERALEQAEELLDRDLQHVGDVGLIEFFPHEVEPV